MISFSTKAGSTLLRPTSAPYIVCDSFNLIHHNLTFQKEPVGNRRHDDHPHHHQEGINNNHQNTVFNFFSVRFLLLFVAKGRWRELIAALVEARPIL